MVCASRAACACSLCFHMHFSACCWFVGGSPAGRGSLSHRDGNREESLKERGKERDMDQLRKEN